MSAYHGRLIFTGDDQTGKRMSELNFKGKEFVFNHHLAVPHRPLVPDPAKSIGAARLDGNLVIHGDNLHALKSLLPMYAGKVDCIFIDDSMANVEGARAVGMDAIHFTGAEQLARDLSARGLL